MKPKIRDFEVQVIVKAWLSKTVKATSFEQALEIGRELKEADFLDMEPNSLIDGSIAIQGVFDSAEGL